MVTEVENLIARITGDASSYVKAADAAVSATKRMESRVVKSTDEVSERFSALGSKLRLFGENASQAIAAIGIKEWLKEAVHAWGEAEAASLRLDAAIRTSGGNVESLGRSYRDFAADVQEVTVVEDDVVVKMLASAESMELHGEAAKRAAKNAIALSAALTGSADAAQSYLRQGAMIEQGQIDRLKRIIPVLRNVRTQEEARVKVQKLLASGFAQAKAEAESHIGSIKQLKNAYGDLMEQIGELIAGQMKPFIKWITDGIKWLQKLSPEVKRVAAAFASLATVILGLRPAVLLLGSIFTPHILTLMGVAAAAVLLEEKFGLLEKTIKGLQAAAEAWKIAAQEAIIAVEFLAILLLDVFKRVEPFVNQVKEGLKVIGGVAGQWAADFQRGLQIIGLAAKDAANGLDKVGEAGENAKKAKSLIKIFAEFREARQKEIGETDLGKELQGLIGAGKNKAVTEADKLGVNVGEQWAKGLEKGMDRGAAGIQFGGFEHVKMLLDQMSGGRELAEDVGGGRARRTADTAIRRFAAKRVGPEMNELSAAEEAAASRARLGLDDIRARKASSAAEFNKLVVEAVERLQPARKAAIREGMITPGEVQLRKEKRSIDIRSLMQAELESKRAAREIPPSPEETVEDFNRMMRESKFLTDKFGERRAKFATDIDKDVEDFMHRTKMAGAGFPGYGFGPPLKGGAAFPGEVDKMMQDADDERRRNQLTAVEKSLETSKRQLELERAKVNRYDPEDEMTKQTEQGDKQIELLKKIADQPTIMIVPAGLY